MAKNRKRKHILVIDDNIEYCEKLRIDARNNNLKVTYFHNLENGIEELEKSKKYLAVILDGRCPITNDQQHNTAKSNFVFQAMQKLKDIEHIYDRILPFCVNAINPNDFNEDLEGITKVFKKEEEHNIMFKYIKEEINKLPETQLINKFNDVFDFFDEYFTDKDEELLIDLLSELNDNDTPKIVSKLTLLRRLEEKLFDIVSINYLKQNPNKIETNNSSRTKSILFKIKNKMPKYLFDFAMDIYSLSSKYGAHNLINNKNNFLPTKYTVNSLAYAFLELCVWAEDLIERKNNE